MTESLTLGFDLRFADLYGRDGLVRLDGHFVDFLKAQDPELHNRLMAARAAPEQVAGKPESDLIVELAPRAGGVHRRAVRHRPRGAGAAGAP